MTRNPFAAMLVAAAAFAGGAPSMVINASDAGPGIDIHPDFYRDRKGKGQRNRRGKGKTSPPKSRPNRLHVSKRVRRKHRRAA